MASRHLSRSIAMQSLYEWDFRGRHIEMLPEIVQRNAKEFGPGIDDPSFISDLVNGVLGKINELDTGNSLNSGNERAEVGCVRVVAVEQQDLTAKAFESFLKHLGQPPSIVVVGEDNRTRSELLFFTQITRHDLPVEIVRNPDSKSAWPVAREFGI